MNRWIIISLILVAAAALIQANGASGQENKIGGGQVTTPPTPEPDADEPTEAEDKPSSLGMNRTQVLISSLTIFMLAIFVGFEVITKVPPTLHTPLMSGSNAISGITIIGAIIVTGVAFNFSSLLGFIALVLAAINVVGGFLVTHRMLSMFNKR